MPAVVRRKFYHHCSSRLSLKLGVLLGLSGAAYIKHGHGRVELLSLVVGDEFAVPVVPVWL